jgi:hypothetical protein
MMIQLSSVHRFPKRIMLTVIQGLNHNSSELSWNVQLILPVLVTIIAFYIPVFAASTAQLVQQSDLIYLGAFRVPPGTTADANSLNYGGISLGFNPANTSLFMTGYDPQQYSTEVHIPSLVNSTNIANLLTATLLQPLQDPTEGQLHSINPSDPNPQKVGGHLVYNGKLYVTGYSYYDGAGTQTASHFVRPTNFATHGQVQGPSTVGTQYPGFVSGYMTLIPLEWQSQFGGPALTGNCCLAIVGEQSSGPAASVFNPSDVGTTDPVAATPVVGYPYAHPLGSGWGTTNPLFNGTTQIRGLVFPSGTRSVLFIGRHGVGTFCYGPGADCNDPADSSKGTHAYPYKYQIWAYDANELVAVKNGVKQQWAVTPYAVWNFSLPFENANDAHLIGGAAYDPQTHKLYISQQCADAYCTPIIHVFQVP